VFTDHLDWHNTSKFEVLVQLTCSTRFEHMHNAGKLIGPGKSINHHNYEPHS
jgi:hypothetical protein